MINALSKASPMKDVCATNLAEQGLTKRGLHLNVVILKQWTSALKTDDCPLYRQMNLVRRTHYFVKAQMSERKASANDELMASSPGPGPKLLQYRWLIHFHRLQSHGYKDIARQFINRSNGLDRPDRSGWWTDRSQLNINDKIDQFSPDNETYRWLR